MTKLEATAEKVSRELRAMASKLLRANQPDLCDLADQLADELDTALRWEPPEDESGPVIELKDSESSETRSSKDIRAELAKVSQNLRDLTGKLKED